MTACQSRFSPPVFSNFNDSPWLLLVKPVEDDLGLDLSVIGIGHALEAIHDERFV